MSKNECYDFELDLCRKGRSRSDNVFLDKAPRLTFKQSRNDIPSFKLEQDSALNKSLDESEILKNCPKKRTLFKEHREIVSKSLISRIVNSKKRLMKAIISTNSKFGPIPKKLSILSRLERVL